MFFLQNCPQCSFLSLQVGRPTACLLHVEPGTLSTTEGANAPVAEACRPTCERPAPFTLREYARLLVLRSRVQEEVAQRREQACEGTR